jgi:signal transduction histidine kinase/ligand-binding sensor domain-containing protein
MKQLLTALGLLLLRFHPVCSALNTKLLISQYQKQHWQMEDGLPHNYVFTIQRAPDGYLLVGTDEGLTKFDGMQFAPYDLDPSIKLSKKWILSMLIGRDGSIWVGTFDGNLYQWRAGKIVTRFNEGSSIFDITEDSRGRVWASTRNGIVRFNQEEARFEHQRQLRRPPDTAWNVLTRSQDGSVWVVTIDGLYRSKDGFSIECVARNGSQYGEFFSVRPDFWGVLVGTSKGLYSVTDRNGAVAFERVFGVPGPVVASLRDRDGNVWAGTWGQGLYCKNGRGVQRWSSREGLADDFVRQLYEDQEGNLWIGLRGGGLSRWKNPALVPFGTPEGLRGDYASTVVLDPQGRTWLGTWRGGLYRFEKEKLLPQPTPVSTIFFTIRTLAFDGAGRLWTGNWEGIFLWDGRHYKHFAEPDAPYRHVSVILFDRLQKLWVATSDNGIFIFPQGYPEGRAAVHLLNGTEITSLVDDLNGRIWVGTSTGAGWVSVANPTSFHELTNTRGELFISLSLDTRKDVWGCSLSGMLWHLHPHRGESLGVNEGLPGYPLYLAIDDGRGAMWVSSSRGILRIETKKIRQVFLGVTKRVDYRLFDREDGMRTIECHHVSQPSGGRDSKGYLWFATSRGFVRIDPNSLHLPQIVSNVRIEQVIEDGKVETSENLRLSPGPHTVEIRFAALEFSSPQKLRFRYRMEGLERDWNWDKGSRAAFYTRLPPGRYTFRVAAAIGDGPWSEAHILRIEQLPKFYQTRWFEILVLLFGSFLVILILRWQMHLFRQRYLAVTAERNRIASEWHDTLLAGFSAISLQLEAALLELTETSDQVRQILSLTRKMVEHYRIEARRIIWDLRESSKGDQTLQSAIDAVLHQTLKDCGIAYELKVSGVEFELSGELKHNLLRVCQEAVNNAVKHGVPKCVRIFLRYEQDELSIRIVDDGTGFDPKSIGGLTEGHFGLSIMQERVHRFGGVLSVKSVPGEGTVVEAKIPIYSDKRGRISSKKGTVGWLSKSRYWS